MNNILDKCIFIRCPLKDSCLRYGKKRRENQLTVFRYNCGCKFYFNIKHLTFNKRTNIMRNKDLDKKLPVDEKIGPLKGDIRIVGGKKIIQIEEKTQAQIDLNLVINRWRLR